MEFLIFFLYFLWFFELFFLQNSEKTLRIFYRFHSKILLYNCQNWDFSMKLWHILSHGKIRKSPKSALSCPWKREKFSPLKSGFQLIWVFTKQLCHNASKWPQMHQKWLNTISEGSGETLVTLKHDLKPIYCCFITYFGVGSSLVLSGAPWCPLTPPLTPWRPPDLWYVIPGHSQSFWVILGHVWAIGGQ